MSDETQDVVKTSAVGPGNAEDELFAETSPAIPAAKNAAPALDLDVSIIDRNENYPVLADTYERGGVVLEMEYWKVDEEGEERLCVFEGMDWMSTDTGAQLEVAVFSRNNEKGSRSYFRNGSRALVGKLTDLAIAPGTVMFVTYKGEQVSKKDSKKKYHVFEIELAVLKS